MVLLYTHTSLVGCAMVKTCTTFWGSTLGRTYHKSRRVWRSTLVCDTRGSRNWSNTRSQKSRWENSSCQAASELIKVWRETSSNARSWHVLTNQGKRATSVCLCEHKIQQKLTYFLTHPYLMKQMPLIAFLLYKNISNALQQGSKYLSKLLPGAECL